jgi:excisionase family DNA binding protein
MAVTIYEKTEGKSDFSIGLDPNVERVFTTEQVCQVLNLGMNSVLGLLKTKKLRSKRVGRKYLITTSAILEFLKN